jgi:vacuolar-type H+-ATPase subunit F/Vma7
VARDGTVAALGEATLVSGFALAAVRVVEAEDDEAVRTAWQEFPAEVAVVIITPAAAQALGAAAFEPGAPLTVVFKGAGACVPREVPPP